MDKDIETKKINQNKIQKIDISPRENKDYDIIIETEDDTVFIRIIENMEQNINSAEGWQIAFCKCGLLSKIN